MSIYSEIKPEVRMFADMCVENSRIDPELYLKYDVKRGLRDLNGKGVLTGLTNISEIISSKTVDGKSVPCEGELYYRGYSVEELLCGLLLVSGNDAAADQRSGPDNWLSRQLYCTVATYRTNSDHRTGCSPHQHGVSL